MIQFSGYKLKFLGFRLQATVLGLKVPVHSILALVLRFQAASSRFQIPGSTKGLFFGLQAPISRTKAPVSKLPIMFNINFYFSGVMDGRWSKTIVMLL